MLRLGRCSESAMQRLGELPYWMSGIPEPQSQVPCASPMRYCSAVTSTASSTMKTTQPCRGRERVPLQSWRR